MLNGLDKLELFGESRGYRKTNESQKIMKEASASILWEILLTTSTLLLIWNAFPFPPFQGANEQSNRKPTRG